EPAVELDPRVGTVSFVLVVARIARRRLLDPFTVAIGAAGAEQEHGQPLVKVAPLADLLALIEDRSRDTVARAVEHAGFDEVERIIERVFPSPPKVHAAR